MELFTLGFPYSFILIGIGLLIGLCIAASVFGFILLFLILFVLYLDMIHITPLIKYIQEWIVFLFPVTIRTMQKRIHSMFQVKNKVIPHIDQPSIFLFHPHGIFITSAYFHTLTKETNWPFKGRLTALSTFLRLPFAKEIFQLLNIVPSEYDAMESVVKGGENLYVVPGGIREMMQYTTPNKMQLVIKNRKGVFRMALKTGANLVPVISYGENEQVEYMKIPVLHNLFVNYSIPFMIPTLSSIWKWIIGDYPPIETHIGAPIKVEKQEPTEEAIEKIRKKYITNLKQLYKDTKPASYEKKLIIR